MSNPVGSIKGYITFLEEKLKSAKGKEKKALKLEITRYKSLFNKLG